MLTLSQQRKSSRSPCEHLRCKYVLYRCLKTVEIVSTPSESEKHHASLFQYSEVSENGGLEHLVVTMYLISTATPPFPPTPQFHPFVQSSSYLSHKTIHSKMKKSTDNLQTSLVFKDSKCKGPNWPSPETNNR